MNKAFTLVEILIVVAILGILAALTLPIFQDHMTEAKEAAAKENLRLLRNAIQINTVLDIMDEGYLTEIPENPFNHLNTITPIAMGPFPAEATGNFGWIYHIPTQTVRLDWPGTDKNGVRYYDY